MSLATQVLEICMKHNFMLATAESCTGGMIIAALTDIAGSSAVVDRGFVTYSNDAKSQMLGVDPQIITQYGAVSQEVAHAMADGALQNSRAHIALSVTGVAGPGASEAKPEGMVWFGLAMKNRETRTQLHQFGPLGRSEVRRMAVKSALEMALEAVSTYKP